MENKKIEREEDDDNVSEYSPKSDFSKAGIIAEAIIKARNSRAEEMKRGYSNYKFDKDNNAVKVWIPDTRKIFCANIDALLSLLAPEISNNKRMLDVMEKFEEQKETIFDEFCYHERFRCQLSDGKAGWKLTGRKWMPEIDEELPVEDPKYPNSAVRWFASKGIHNPLINRYWDEILKIYDKLFSEINLLIASVNYFKKSASYK